MIIRASKWLEMCYRDIDFKDFLVCVCVCGGGGGVTPLSYPPLARSKPSAFNAPPPPPPPPRNNMSESCPAATEVTQP